MVKPTGAQEYGYHLGKMQLGIQQMFQQISEGFRLAMTPPERLSLEDIEKKRERIYQDRIIGERQLGMRYIRGLVREEEVFWGLNKK